MLCDYHLHSLFSPDSESKIKDICECAVKRGLSEIAITDHCDLYAGDPEFKAYDMGGYFKAVSGIRAEFEGKLAVKYGIELGQGHIYKDSAEKILNDSSFDFVIGSLHNIENDLDLACISYTGENKDCYVEEYFKELFEFVKTADCDCFGHIDYIKRYIFASKLEYPKKIEDEYIDEILKTIIERGKGIEINTSGLRKPDGYIMPSERIVKRYKELGGEILTVGSDAHTAQTVGSGIEEGLKIAQVAGFRYFATFDGRKPRMNRILL